VSVSLTLWDSTTSSSIAQAEASAEAAGYRVEELHRTLLQSVASLYLGALGQEQLAEVAGSAVMASLRHLDLVQARIDAGTAAAADRLPIEVELAQARLQATQAESALSQTLADLRATIGLPSGPPLKLSETLTPVPEEKSLDELLEQIPERPDVQQQEAQVQAQWWAVKLAEQNASLSYSVTAQGDYGRHTGVQGETWRLGAGVTYPLYSRGARADVTSARASLTSVQAQLAELELQARRQIEQAYLALTAAREQITAAEVAEQNARMNLEAAEARYAEGVAMIIEVTDAEQSLRSAEAARVRAVYEYSLAHVQLLTAVGADLLQSLGAQQ